MCQISHIRSDIPTKAHSRIHTQSRMQKHAQKRSPLRSRVMSTEIKLVYYFQRGKKKLRNKKQVFFYTSDY